MTNTELEIAYGNALNRRDSAATRAQREYWASRVKQLASQLEARP